MRKYKILIAVFFIFSSLELLFRISLGDNFNGRFDYGFKPMVGIDDSKKGQVFFKRTTGRKFWPQNYASSLENSKIKIFVIGDSIARGSSLDKSYSKLLESNLNKNSRNTYEVWNLSIAGYGAERKKLVLEDTLRFKPDLIIFHVGMSNEFEDERDKRLLNQYSGFHPKYWPMKSYLLRFLDEIQQQKIKTKLLPPEIRIQTMSTDIDDEALASQDLSNLKRWNETFSIHTSQSLNLFKKHGVPYVFVPRVIFDEISASVTDDGLYESLSKIIKNEDLIDLKSNLSSHSLPDLFSKDRVHLTDTGHQIVADILTREIVDKSLLGPFKK